MASLRSSATAPGLSANPIVDMSVGLDDPDDDAAFVPAMIGAGYPLRSAWAPWQWLATVLPRVPPESAMA